MLPPPLRIALTQTGKMYVWKSTNSKAVGLKVFADTVTTFGEVLSVSGLSAQYGPDKKFKYDTVTITVVDRTEELLAKLLEQGKRHEEV